MPRINTPRRPSARGGRRLMPIRSTSGLGPRPATRPSGPAPVSTVSTAPVAIGNSVRGSKTYSSATAQGQLVSGRDFMFVPIGTYSVTSWTLVGGTPLTPAAFADSALRAHMQLYQKFRWRKCTLHYITSSATNQTGDVMFYYSKNRQSVFLNQTSNQLLPFVMSDPNTVLGPQWTNHSAMIDVVSDWKSTDYGMSPDINDFAAGEVFLLSKTTDTDSPGYVLFDYEIEFAQMQVHPRLLTLPISRIQWSQVNLGYSAVAVAADGSVFTFVQGNNLSNTASAAPSGNSVLDIYKVVLDITNSNSAAWLNVTAASGFRLDNASGTDVVLPLTDGVTIYAVATQTGGFTLYPSVVAAFAQNGALRWNVTATVTYNIQTWMSYIGSINADSLKPSY